MDGTTPSYPSDLTDTEWEAIRRVIPAAKAIGVDRKTSMRAVVNAIFYRSRSGCPWRMLPHDFPHWRTVYGYFRQWHLDGTWKRIQLKRGNAAGRPGQTAVSLSKHGRIFQKSFRPRG